MDVLDGVDFDPADPAQVNTLVRLFGDYLAEELERTGRMVPGFAVAGFLRTLIVRVGGAMAGFVAVDVKRRSVETIYVAPEYRRRGAATLVLANLAHGCPQPMALKAPLSPGGEALAGHLGLGVAHSTPEQVADLEQTLANAEDTIRRHCKHKRTGDPRKPCRRCYRTGVLRYAEVTVRGYAAGAIAMNDLIGGPLGRPSSR